MSNNAVSYTHLDVYKRQTLPDLISDIAFFTSIVTVADLGFGINPFGPKDVYKRQPY